MRTWLAALVLAVPSLAVASPPITAGVDLGLAQSKADGDQGADATHTLGLFGRVGFTGRLGAQLELSKIDTGDYSDSTIRKATALLVVELGSRANFYPILLVGIGLDRESSNYGYSRNASHIEGGFGLEYRIPNGLTIGADIRMGGRSIDEEDYAYPTEGGIRKDGQTTTIASYTPSSLQEGEYRAARLTLGVRF
jgi:hypothetical protein